MNKRYSILIIILLSIALVLNCGLLIKYFSDSKQQEDLYTSLIETAESASTSPKTKKCTSACYELYRQNKDTVARIKINGTKINYPVMQSKSSPDFYLKHNFKKQYSPYGCPYVQENCDVNKPSDNIIIYGHNMSDNSMFSGLMKYTDKSYWLKHKTIQFDTLSGQGEYEILSVFKTVVNTDSPNSFKYYQFTDANTPEDFDMYIKNCKKLSLYDTGITAKYGDKLITLSTCEYSHKNGRLVIVAKKCMN